MQKDRILCANNAPDSKNRYMLCVWYISACHGIPAGIWFYRRPGRMGDSRETTTFERERKIGNSEVAT